MNTIKKIIALAIFIFCTCFLYAQKMGFNTSEEKLNFQKRIMSSSSFIFEGTVTSQKCYRQSPNGTILTCSTLEITKIFKGSGQIKLGTIKLITQQGGSIPEEHPNNEEYVAETVSDGARSGIGKGTYLVFGNLAGSSMLGSPNSPTKTATTNNTLVIQVYDLIDLKKLSWSSVEVNFKTINELYSFLNDNGGLTVQEEKK
jgi:hypothetical protein